MCEPIQVAMHPPILRFRFEVKQVLSNSMGQNNAGIFIVDDQLTGSKCIEKRLNPSDVVNGRAMREIGILVQLAGHPNIIQLIDFDLHTNPQLPKRDPSASAWTEYCDRGTLYDLVIYLSRMGEAQRLAEPFLWHVLRSLVEAVHYCQQGPKNCSGWNTVYHRDINLSNIFLATQPDDSFPRVVLGDFGLSTTIEHIKLGSSDDRITSNFERFFAPPEAPSYHKESDIFQIGAVMYCLMIGTPLPYSGPAPLLANGQRGWLEHHIWFCERTATEPYSDALVSVVSACLQEDFSTRPSISKLKEVLETV